MPAALAPPTPFTRAWDTAAKESGLTHAESSRSFARKERIKLAADGEERVCLIRSGHLVLLGVAGDEERIIRVVGSGELVGYGLWMVNGASDYLLEGIERGSVSLYPRTALLRAQRQSPGLQDLIIEMLCRTIIVKDERIMALEEGSARQRVKSLLYSLAKKFGEKDKDGIAIGVELSRVMMAKLASVAPANLSRILTDLVEEDVLVRRRRRLVVKDLRRVMARARGRDLPA